MSDRQDGTPPTAAERLWEQALSVRDQLAALEAADLSALADDDVDGLPEVVEEAMRIGQRLQVKVAQEVCDRGIPQARGCRSNAAYLQAVLRIPRSEVTARLRAADRFHPRVALSGEQLPPRFPHVAAAQSAGEISADHARVIATCLERLPAAVPPETRDDVEGQLVGYARDFDPAGVYQCAQVLADGLDPDGTLAEANEKYKKRAFTITKTSHGMYKLNGLLDPESADILQNALRPLARPANTAEVKDERTVIQCNADALVMMATWASADPRMPDHAGRRPQVVITTTLAELQAKTGLAYLDSGDLVPIETLIRALQDSDASLAVFGDKGEVLWFGREQRTAPLGLRRALEARDKGCVQPGCPAPPQHCQVMHSPAFEDGGTTDPDHNALGCLPHHRQFDDPNSGWQLVMIDGIPHTIAPPWLDPTRTPRRNHVHDPPT